MYILLFPKCIMRKTSPLKYSPRMKIVLDDHEAHWHVKDSENLQLLSLFHYVQPSSPNSFSIKLFGCVHTMESTGVEQK